MTRTIVRLGFALGLALALGMSVRAEAQTRDHLQCFQVRDPLKLKGTVDVESKLGLEPGCKISRVGLYCSPAEKTVVAANVAVLSIDGAALPGDLMCYRILCRKPFPPDQDVTDQFGSRQVKMLVPKLLCAPVATPVATPTPTPAACAGGCDDHLACTSDACVAGICTHSPIDADQDTFAAAPCGPDCDDSNPAVSPNAVEVCGDTIDNDCDGLIDVADHCVGCGDGIVAGGESCDGANLNGTSCSDFGFTGGALACSASCSFDTSACTSALVCNPGSADCDGNVANGCEANLATSLLDCGACGNACFDANPCMTAACSAAFCSHQPSFQGTACDDGQPQTVNDVCNGQGTCVGTAAP
jgi:hypothetical protein